MVRVKICGITRAEDLVYALNEGADAIGFVLEPTSPRYVGEHHYDIYFNLCGPYATSVAVFGDANRTVPEAMAIQALTFGDFALPGQKLIQALRLRNGDQINSISLLPGIEAVLLDSYSEAALGGTGQMIDWDYAAEIADNFSRRGVPTILAGGLTPENVGEAVAKVQPYAVDVSSGVESAPGVKDPYKVRDFIQAVR